MRHFTKAVLARGRLGIAWNARSFRFGIPVHFSNRVQNRNSVAGSCRDTRSCLNLRMFSSDCIYEVLPHSSLGAFQLHCSTLRKLQVLSEIRCDQIEIWERRFSSTSSTSCRAFSTASSWSWHLCATLIKCLSNLSWCCVHGTMWRSPRKWLVARQWKQQQTRSLCFETVP